jgi:hypothetical protein
MTTVSDLHPQAMDLADEAFHLKRIGQEGAAHGLFLRALDLEQSAASLLPPTEDSEPSRSILYRSAASLAYNIGQYDTAERLIALGLTGFPPLEIREELRHLYEDVNFQLHLAHQGIELSKSQWVMTLFGNAVSYGATSVEPLLLRVEKVRALFYRTIERMTGNEYKVNGYAKLRDTFGLFVNAFAPSSFAVSFQVGAPTSQGFLFPEHEDHPQIEPDTVVSELIDCLEILESAYPERLKERIPDETYYTNFVGLVQQIAPDGEDIKAVAFRKFSENGDKPVTLRKRRSQFKVSNYSELTPPRYKEPIKETLTGILTYASSRSKKEGTVKLVELETRTPITIKVPLALMKDVVQPYYEEKVTIVALRKGKELHLDEIGPAEK